MTSRFVHVIRPGLQTTVQDLGRWGWQTLGVGVAGPMDAFSHRLANALLANPRQAATLEITLIGPELEFEHQCCVAVAGAEFDVKVDGALMPRAQPVDVRAHARMTFGERKRGARAYLAINGGFDVPVVLGSRSTHVPSGIGGCAGRSLRKGDRLAVAAATLRPGRPMQYTAHLFDAANQQPTLRVLPGPDEDRFRNDALDTLQSAPYVIQPESDRMGLRLRGVSIAHAGGADIVSDATPTGTVQVPGSGQPILLMADRQTSGGYPRVATVITADIGIAAQRAPGEAVSFQVCTMAEAMSALIAQENVLLAIEGAAS